MDDPADQAAQASQPNTETPQAPSNASIAQVQTLLKAKDDTQRFVGLALLKSVLDNTPNLREDEHVIETLWSSTSAKFLDRLLRTGSKPSGKDTKEMLTLAVSVLHTFAALLPESAVADRKFTDRIPALVGAILYSSDETTGVLLQLLHKLVSTPEGAKSFISIDDLSSLTEIAPAHSTVLDIFSFAWLNWMTIAEDRNGLSSQINDCIQGLVSSFTGTDAVTLLEFLGTFLRQADPAILPPDPKWLKTVAGYIRNLVTGRPNMAARSGYTNASASLLQAFPSSCPPLLFSDRQEKGDEKPFGYLLINLMLIDIRSSAPNLLEQLNRPNYPNTSRRLASAFDVISIFIGYLVRSLEDESMETFVMAPDSLLKLRKGISETMSVTTEYLRDRWDATFAGAMGLHPDARPANTETSTGSHRTLAWDSKVNSADKDPFILSAIRALALWLREDENETLRGEATGLIDMLMELYQTSSPDELDFRSASLVAMEALVTSKQGRDMFLQNHGWKILTTDLAEILQQSSAANDAPSASRGIEIVRILLPMAEEESTSGSGVPEEWMDIVTTVAAWQASAQQRPTVVQEFHVVVLQLCCTLIVGAQGGMKSRYKHSISAIRGVASQLSYAKGQERFLREEMEDILDTMNGLVATVR